jgi:hypothetical protein
MDYKRFAADVGPHPGKGWTLDRIKTRIGYRRGNTRWATRRTQQRNRRCNVANPHIAQTIRDLYATRCYWQRDLAELFGCSPKTISNIVRRDPRGGWA